MPGIWLTGTCTSMVMLLVSLFFSSTATPCVTFLLFLLLLFLLEMLALYHVEYLQFEAFAGTGLITRHH